MATSRSNKVRLIRMSDNPYGVGQRTGWGMTKRALAGVKNSLFYSDEEIRRRELPSLSTRGSVFFNPETGEIEDYDPNTHYIDENFDGKFRASANAYGGTQSGIRSLGGLLGLVSPEQTFYGVPKVPSSQLEIDRLIDEKFREDTSTPISRGERTGYEESAQSPAQSIRSYARGSDYEPRIEPIAPSLSSDFLTKQQEEDDLFRDATSTDMSMGKSEMTPQGVGQGPSALPWQQENPKYSPEFMAGRSQIAMDQIRDMNRRKMPTAAQFDDYLNQSLRDPNSSINAGLANMRAQSQAQTQSRMQNTRMNALAESVDPSATTMPMSASPFASNDFRNRLSSPYSAPASSGAIAQSGRELADANYAELTRKSLGMDRELNARTKAQTDARVETTLGRLRAASDAIYAPSLGSPRTGGSISVSGPQPVLGNTRSQIFGTPTKRVLTPEEEDIEMQMENFRQGLRRPQGQSTRPQFPY